MLISGCFTGAGIDSNPDNPKWNHTSINVIGRPWNSWVHLSWSYTDLLNTYYIPTQRLKIRQIHFPKDFIKSDLSGGLLTKRLHSAEYNFFQNRVNESMQQWISSLQKSPRSLQVNRCAHVCSSVFCRWLSVSYFFWGIGSLLPCAPFNESHPRTPHSWKSGTASPGKGVWWLWRQTASESQLYNSLV